MRRATCTRSLIALLVALFVALVNPGEAWAPGCNIIPRRAQEHPAIPADAQSAHPSLGVGRVVNAIAGPGDVVVVTAGEGCNPATPGFADPGSDNVVNLVFVSPNGQETTVLVDSDTQEADGCVSVPSGTFCSVLRFEVPNTTGPQFGLPAGRSLTGPACILVTNNGETVADICQIGQPTSACEDFALDRLFGHFIVLPPPNVLVEPSIPEILGAPTLFGDVVFPWDHDSIRLTPAGVPEATVFEVDTAEDDDLADESCMLALNELGLPIPPLLRLVERPDGTKFTLGTTDVHRAATRVSASCLDPGEAFAAMVSGIGPIVLPGGTVTVRSASPLVGLRSSTEAVAFAADEEILGDLNADGDALDKILQSRSFSGVFNDTSEALSELRTSPPRPTLLVDGDLAAYLQSEGRSGYADQNGDGDAVDDILRVSRLSTGDALTDGPPSVDVSVDHGRAVDGGQIAISRSNPTDPDAFVFFRTNEGDEAGRSTDLISQGSQSNGDNNRPSSDFDGDHVAWDSVATNLLPGTFDQRNVFVETPGGRMLVSESSPGVGGNADSLNPDVSSADGYYVAFESAATNLAPLNSPSSTVVVERVVNSSTTLDGSLAFGTFELTLDYAACTTLIDGVEVVFADDPTFMAAGTFEAHLLAGFFAPGCDFHLDVPVGTYTVTPAPLGVGSVIALGGPVTIVDLDPPLPSGLTNLQFVGTLTVTGMLGPVFDFEGSFDFDILADVDTGAGASNVYVADLGSGGSIHPVSMDASGVAGNADSGSASISSGGRFVAFDSDATNLVAGDTNGVRDVLVHDRDADEDSIFDETGVGETETSRVSVTSSGAQALGGDSSTPAISAGGRFVAFTSLANNLAGSDANGFADVFVHDRDAGTTERISVNSNGAEATGGASFAPSISADGRCVAFASDATDLVTGDTNGFADVFLHDRDAGTTERISVDSNGAEALGGDSLAPSLSADCRFVAFESDATNLVPGDTLGHRDVFRFDSINGSVELISQGSEANGPSGGAAVCGSGLCVAFESDATNLTVIDPGVFTNIYQRGPGACSSVNSDADCAEPVLQVFDTAGRSLLDDAPMAASRVVTAAGRALVAVPEASEGTANLNDDALTKLLPVRGDVDTDDEVVHLYDAALDAMPLDPLAVVNLGVAVTDFALSSEVICLAVSESGENGTDLNNSGAPDGSVLVVGQIGDFLPTPTGNLTNVGLATDRVGATGTLCVLTIDEAAEGDAAVSAAPCGALSPPGGCDLNDDGDNADQVLAFVDTGTLAITNVGQAAQDFQIGPNGRLVAFRTCEADQGATDLNGDSDADDCVMQVYDLVEAGLASGASSGSSSSGTNPINTGFAAIPCDFPGCGAFNLGGISKDGAVCFPVTEEINTRTPQCLPSEPSLCDLDGDGDGSGTVIVCQTFLAGGVTSTQVTPVAEGVQNDLVVGGEVAENFTLGTELTECDAAIFGGCVTADELNAATVDGFAPAPPGCGAADITGPGDQPDGQLDCTTLLFFFVGDLDGDGVLNPGDNAPQDPNPEQTDSDDDGVADQNDPEPDSVLPCARPDAANLDGDMFNGQPLIDSVDVALCYAFRDQPAAGAPLVCADQKDLDMDLVISVLDCRAIADQCTLPDCASPAGSLVVNQAGSGSGSVDPGGGSYAAGMEVTLTATASVGSKFTGWSGDATGAQNPISLTIDADPKTVTATFEPVSGGQCGLLGVEALLPIGVALALRRRRKGR